MANTSTPIPIIDSHIHLYPESEAQTLGWMSSPSLPPALSKDHTLTEYQKATTTTTTSSPSSSSSSPAVQGFVAIEAGRINAGSQDWAHPLSELSFLRSQSQSQSNNPACLGIVPWAPLNLGPEKLAEYLVSAEQTAGPETWQRVKGFRYLLQDQPSGTGLEAQFIEALKVLGRRGYVFDVGVDQHRRGRAQLEELVDMIDRAHEGVEREEERVVFVLNHLCKPDMTIINYTTDPSFVAWRTAMFTLSRCRRTYMKLSGCFEELSDKVKTWSADDIFAAIIPWLAVVIAAFGPSRIMFGSNWPVCTIGVEDVDPADNAWAKWQRVVEKVCDMAGLSEEGQKMLWAGTAREAYKL